MKNTAKLIVAGAFALGALFVFLSANSFSRTGAAVFSDSKPTPTPPKTTNTKPANVVAANLVLANSAANTAITNASNSNLSTFPFGHPTGSPVSNTVSNTVAANASSGGKKIAKSFTLGQNSMSEHGDVAFNHENHAEKKYSADGKSVLGCVECHHTDQPKKALKLPLVTSERDEILNEAVYQKSDQKVSTCRTCHFQDGEDIPEGKTMPVLDDTELNNKEAYHRNCNVCHDEAYRLRKEVVRKIPGFATTNDCTTCHKPNK